MWGQQVMGHLESRVAKGPDKSLSFLNKEQNMGMGRPKGGFLQTGAAAIKCIKQDTVKQSRIYYQRC